MPDAQAARSIRTALGSSRGLCRSSESALPKLRKPLIITARDPHEGGARKFDCAQRRDLLDRFLNHAAYMDIELRSARALRSLLELAEKKNVAANHFIP